jgi:hypothetical protein
LLTNGGAFGLSLYGLVLLPSELVVGVLLRDDDSSTNVHADGARGHAAAAGFCCKHESLEMCAVMQIVPRLHSN